MLWSGSSCPPSLRIRSSHTLSGVAQAQHHLGRGAAGLIAVDLELAAWVGSFVGRPGKTYGLPTRQATVVWQGICRLPCERSSTEKMTGRALNPDSLVAARE